MALRPRAAILITLVAAASVAAAQRTCTVDQDVGCFQDNLPDRIFPITANFASTDMDHALCAQLCDVFGSKYAGVEYGYQCFCGNDVSKATAAPKSDCNMTCQGHSSETCGAADRMDVFTYTCTGERVPYGHSCLDAASAKLPFCDTSLSIEKRLDDLVGRLNLTEMIGLLGPSPATSDCAFLDYGVPRLGIPPYLHLVETNTAVAAACIGDGKCATTFSGPTGLGASFNRTMWKTKGEVVSTEMRAFNNLGWHRGAGVPQYISLTGFGPNINIIRDPRFGRNSELPSEDPLLAGEYGKTYVKACQEGSDPKYLKMIAGLKHYDAYSVETNRMSFNAEITTFDLWDTYLPQYEIAFVEGQPRAVMCSYASINGVPSCANDFILNQVMRGKWGRNETLVATDCGAINNMVNGNHYAKNTTDAVAKAIKGGTNMELGDRFFTTGYLAGAVSSGMLTQGDVANSVRTALRPRFQTGLFDPINATTYTSLGIEDIASPEHQKVNFDAAVQSIVLLRNSGKTLPLKAGLRVAVVGPHSVSQAGLLSDYAGDQQCADGTDDCIPTIGDMITQVNSQGGSGAKTQVVEGVDVSSTNTSGIAAALDAVKSSDATVLCLGIDHDIEHEGIDRTSINLPGIQEEFAEAVVKAANGKPVVLVLVNGGALGIEKLTALDGIHAIVETFYPSLRGAEGIARSLFGEYNKWGKMPITTYKSDFINECGLTDMNMPPSPKCLGRTYRYYTGEPLWPFGFGLSYTDFNLTCSTSGSAPNVNVSCIVFNLDAARVGDEVVMVYHNVSAAIRKAANHPVPLKRLIDFDRKTIQPGKSATYTFALNAKSFELTTNNGTAATYAGEHTLIMSRGHGAEVTMTVDISAPSLRRLY